MNNRELLINVCREIKPLLDQFVLVGGCSTELLITDSAAPHPRPTQDVDMVVNAITLHDYYHVEAELRELGFSQTMDEQGIICRWEKGILKLDIMPIDEKILGFTNRWYRHAVDEALPGLLPPDQAGQARLEMLLKKLKNYFTAINRD